MMNNKPKTQKKKKIEYIRLKIQNNIQCIINELPFF